MRILKRLGAAALILVVIVAGLALWQREKVARLMAVNTLFAEERIVHNFSHMDELFETRPVPRDGEVTPLPQGTPMERPEGFDDWLERRGVTGIVVLKDGAAFSRNTGWGRARTICGSRGRWRNPTSPCSSA